MEVLSPSLSVLEKLQLGDEKNLLIQGLPSTIEKQFAKLSFAKNVTPLLKTRRIDFALVFAVNQNQLRSIVREVVPALHGEGKFWIAYPKQTSKIVSDLSRDCSWSCLDEMGFESVRMVALDHVWCAVRFKPKEELSHKQPNPEVDLHVNKENRELCVPEDLELRFELQPKARTIFHSLSLANRKEYVTWYLAAKKPETRAARLEVIMEKLLAGKKNPTDK